MIGLYQKIYDNGYFVKADFDFIEDLCLELRIDDDDYLKEFIKFCIKKKIFHAGFYKSNKVLTSNGIQKRFNEATKRRKCKHDVDKYFINVRNNSDNAGNNSDNADISTQRERESKEENTCMGFDLFWKMYDKKVGDKKAIEKKWDSIKEADRALMLIHLPLYKTSQPNKKYRKDPSSYLNQKAWNNEIIFDNESKPSSDNLFIGT